MPLTSLDLDKDLTKVHGEDVVAVEDCHDEV